MDCKLSANTSLLPIVQGNRHVSNRITFLIVNGNFQADIFLTSLWFLSSSSSQWGSSSRHLSCYYITETSWHRTFIVLLHTSLFQRSSLSCAYAPRPYWVSFLHIGNLSTNLPLSTSVFLALHVHTSMVLACEPVLNAGQKRLRLLVRATEENWSSNREQYLQNSVKRRWLSGTGNRKVPALLHINKYTM